MDEPRPDSGRDLRRTARSGDGAALLAAAAHPDLLAVPQLVGEEVLHSLARGYQGLDGLVARLIDQLRERDASGDAELADDLGSRIGIGPAPLLRPLAVDLEELSSALEDDPMLTGGRIDLRTGDVIPRSAFDDAVLDDEDEGDIDDPEVWLSIRSEGSGEAYDDMVDFLDSITDGTLHERLERALHGRGVFRRFKDRLADEPGELERFFRFADDRRIGRARAWLADKGYRSEPRLTW
jgi:hypothetical protein